VRCTNQGWSVWASGWEEKITIYLWNGSFGRIKDYEYVPKEDKMSSLRHSKINAIIERTSAVT
jgi:hypothetical protein